jgi:hypothetical protein
MALRTVDIDETREVREVMTALPETVTPTTSIRTRHASWPTRSAT